jgi:hypothetical protein
MAKNEIHIGNLIVEQLKLQERSASWLARQIYIDESCFRKMLKKQTMDTGRLQDISEVLQHDFFAHFSHYLHKRS